jgi:hypothetical protein
MNVRVGRQWGWDACDPAAGLDLGSPLSELENAARGGAVPGSLAGGNFSHPEVDTHSVVGYIQEHTNRLYIKSGRSRHPDGVLSDPKAN